MFAFLKRNKIPILLISGAVMGLISREGLMNFNRTNVVLNDALYLVLGIIAVSFYIIGLTLIAIKLRNRK